MQSFRKKGKVKLFDNDAFWNGVAQLGDPIQKWNDKYNYGHSFIFLNYTYDENGDIVGFDFWDKTGFHKDLKSDIESWGTKVRGGNLNDKE